MQLQVIAVGERMPSWVREGYAEYARRLPRECALVLREIAPARRGRNYDIERAVAEEGQRILAAVAEGTHVVALHVSGKPWSTADLAQALERWSRRGAKLAFLIGGPDGLSRACLERADETWSLSRLTFPHALVRILLAEQIYRAWSLLHRHPYHR
ncbi:MAG TPA: 23S rRNA (pseudouridine(1915)-N(3))-methyltransferase RlmH [Methylococcus sp.]|nr:23S rRNA (pseudouridine(1915)-N(3))-methyltransferase RlmH [Methylococcus sp.]